MAHATIFMSGRVQPAPVRSYIETHGRGFFCTPFTPNEVLTAFRSLGNGHGEPPAPLAPDPTLSR